MKKKGCIWLFGDGWLKKKVFVMKWDVAGLGKSSFPACRERFENRRFDYLTGIATNYRSDLFEFLL